MTTHELTTQIKGTLTKEDIAPSLIVDAAIYVEHEPPSHNEIVRGLFDTTDKVTLIGCSKARKSFFAMELAMHIAAGRSTFLNLDIPRRRRVLLAQYEIKPDHFHHRLHRAARAHGIEPEELRDWLYVVNGRGIAAARNFAWLSAESKAELVILDPLYKLLDGDENKAEDMKPLLAEFDRLTVNLGVAVMYLHHDRKGITGDRDERDRGAGSGVLARDFDAALYLSDHSKGGHLLVLSGIARNYPPPAEKTIMWEDGRFIMSDIPPEQRTTLTDRQKAKVRGRRNCPGAEEIVERFKTLPSAVTTEQADTTIRAMGATKREAEDVRKDLITQGHLVAWKPEQKHAPTYVGTAEQIGIKRREVETARQKDLLSQ